MEFSNIARLRKRMKDVENEKSEDGTNELLDYMLSDLPVEMIYRLLSFLSDEFIFWEINIGKAEWSLLVPDIIHIKHKEDFYHVLNGNKVRELFQTVVIDCHSTSETSLILGGINESQGHDQIKKALIIQYEISGEDLKQLAKAFNDIENIMIYGGITFKLSDIKNATNNMKKVVSFSWFVSHVQLLMYAWMGKYLELELNFCETLKFVKIDCAYMVDENLMKLAKNFDKVINLSLYNASNLTNSSIESVGRNCPAFESFLLMGSLDVSDEGIRSLSQSCKSLRTLTLHYATMVTNEGLIFLSEQCSNLTSLALYGCFNLPNSAFENISTNCLNLQTLVLEGCMKSGSEIITKEGFEHLIQNSKCLKVFKLQYIKSEQTLDPTYKESLERCVELDSLDANEWENKVGNKKYPSLEWNAKKHYFKTEIPTPLYNIAVVEE